MISERQDSIISSILYLALIAMLMISFHLDHKQNQHLEAMTLTADTLLAEYAIDSCGSLENTIFTKGYTFYCKPANI